jgi:hypothetical protein
VPRPWLAALAFRVLETKALGAASPAFKLTMGRRAPRAHDRVSKNLRVSAGLLAHSVARNVRHSVKRTQNAPLETVSRAL